MLIKSGTLASAVRGAIAAATRTRITPCQQLDMLARDQFLRSRLPTPGGVYVAAHDSSLTPGGSSRSCSFDVEVDCLLRLVAGLGDKAGIAVDQPTLDDGLKPSHRPPPA